MEYAAQVTEALGLVDMGQVDRFIDVLQKCYEDGRSVFAAGNGGSASNASHLVQDLSKGALPDFETAVKRLRALSLTDNVAFITALGNDIGYERVFDLQLRQFAEKGDVLVAISGSGNSANVINAVEYAHETGMTVVGVTGFDGGKLRELSDITIHVPCDDMCQSEAVHSVIFHMVVDLLRERLRDGVSGG